MISWPHRHFWRCGTTRSTVISGHIGHSRNTNKSLPLPDAACGLLARLLSRCRFAQPSTLAPDRRRMAEDMTPCLPPLCALAPPPRLRFKPTSFCALCEVHLSPASAGLAWINRRLKNRAKSCTIMRYCYLISFGIIKNG